MRRQAQRKNNRSGGETRQMEEAGMPQGGDEEDGETQLNVERDPQCCQLKVERRRDVGDKLDFDNVLNRVEDVSDLMDGLRLFQLKPDEAVGGPGRGDAGMGRESSHLVESGLSQILVDRVEIAASGLSAGPRRGGKGGRLTGLELALMLENQLTVIAQEKVRNH